MTVFMREPGARCFCRFARSGEQHRMRCSATIPINSPVYVAESPPPHLRCTACETLAAEDQAVRA